MSEIIGKKILLPLLDDYYLFSYSSDLVAQLVADGFQVTVVLRDKAIRNTMGASFAPAEIILLPTWVRVFLNRSGKILTRVVLWLVARIYARSLSRSFDFAIVPWDNRVVWHTISKSIPSLTIHNTTNFTDNELFLDSLKLTEKTTKKLSHRLIRWLDSKLGLTILPRVGSIVPKYKKEWLLDKFMGLTSPNNLQGFSGISYLTVTGSAVESNYNQLGVGIAPNPTKIFVVGSPNYEHVITLKVNDDERQATRDALRVPRGASLYALFLSPSSFSQIQIREIQDVIRAVSKYRKHSWFMIKFHPKTPLSEVSKVRVQLTEISRSITFITDYTGDDWNAKVILSADCLIIKQGTVGFIAMMHKIPIISYDLHPTNYYDGMYENFECSFHARTSKDIFTSLVALETHQGREKLRRMQQVACEKYLRCDCSPCGQISEIIQHHFNASISNT